MESQPRTGEINEIHQIFQQCLQCLQMYAYNLIWTCFSPLSSLSVVPKGKRGALNVRTRKIISGLCVQKIMFVVLHLQSERYRIKVWIHKANHILENMQLGTSSPAATYRLASDGPLGLFPICNLRGHLAASKMATLRLNLPMIRGVPAASRIITDNWEP